MALPCGAGNCGNRRLPVQDPALETAWAQEGSQPPLYYAVGALLTGWVDTSDYTAAAVRNPFAKLGVPLATDNKNMVIHPPGQSFTQGGTVLAVTLIRWLSVLMGTATAFLAYRLGRTIYPARPAVGLLTAALVAFNPMVLFINASVNNDNLVMLLSTLTLLLLVRDVQSDEPGARWGSTLLLGAILGLAAITKVSGLVLLPVAVLALALSAWPARAWKTWLLRAVTMTLVAAAIAGWWYVRNIVLYGELTGLHAHGGSRRLPARRLPGDGAACRVERLLVLVLGRLWRLQRVGSPLVLCLDRRPIAGGRRGPGAGADPPCTTQATAGALAESSAPDRLHRPDFRRAGPLDPDDRGFAGPADVRSDCAHRVLPGPWLVGLAAGALARNGDAFCWPLDWQPSPWRSLGWPSARLISPRLQSRNCLPAPSPWTCAAATISSWPATGWTRKRPWPVSPWPSRSIGQRPASRTPTSSLSLNGYGYQLENVAKLDTWPGGGLLPTSYWEPGVLYPDRYRLSTKPNSGTPTLVKLGVDWNTDLLHLSQNQSVPCSVGGQPVDSLLLDAGALVSEQPAGPPASSAPIATLQHDIQLLQARTAYEDGQLEVDLTWQATGPVPGDYTAFAHLFDSSGVKVAQADAPPREGYWPTSRWRPSEPVTSTLAIDLPPNLPPGQYVLGVGMYDAASGQRLFAYKPDGSEWRDWVIVLEPELPLP